MVLTPVPKKLCKLIVEGLNRKFKFELESPIYKVKLRTSTVSWGINGSH